MPVQRKSGFVSRLDDELENSWRGRRWGSFFRAWAAAIIITAAAGFIVPLIMLGAYETFVSIVFNSGKGWAQLLRICAGVSAIAGGSALLFTAPVISVKAGQIKPTA
jgi:hypothetical protein